MDIFARINRHFPRSLKTTFLSVYLFILIFFAFNVPVMARDTIEISSSNDFEAPKVEHDLSKDINKDRAGNVIVKARVTDEFSVNSVFLYFRDSLNNKFRKREMQISPGLGKAMYTATVPKESLSDVRIEYYFEAIDKVGNKKLKGLEFSPLKKELHSLSVLDEHDDTKIVKPSIEVKIAEPSKKPAKALSEPMVWVPGL